MEDLGPYPLMHTIRGATLGTKERGARCVRRGLRLPQWGSKGVRPTAHAHRALIVGRCGSARGAFGSTTQGRRRSTTKLRSSFARDVTPACLIINSNSRSRISSTRSTPGWPNAARPHSYGRPIQIAFAPRASALWLWPLAAPWKRNIPLLYGFSCFDQFMIVVAVWVPYLATQGIGMRQFMELQAVFALVILCGELPSGLLSDLWGRKKTLLLGSTLKAVSFSLLPLWSSYAGFLFYHLTMGIALSMISGGDVALLYDSSLAAGGEKSRGTAVLGNANLAAQMGTTVSALLGGAVVSLSYGHLLWANAILSWIPVLLVLRVTEPPATLDRGKKRAEELKELLSTTLVRDGATRLVLLNMVAWGTGGLVMFWVNQ